MKLKQATKETKELYKNLKQKNINCILGYNKKDKYIDIYLPDSKIYIEIDDLLHCISPKQIIIDFKMLSPSKNNFYTVSIPNLVLEEHVDEISDAIVEVVKMRE